MQPPHEKKKKRKKVKEAGKSCKILLEGRFGSYHWWWIHVEFLGTSLANRLIPTVQLLKPMGAGTSTCFFALVIFYFIEVIRGGLIIYTACSPDIFEWSVFVGSYGWLVNLLLFCCQRFSLPRRETVNIYGTTSACVRVVWLKAVITYSFSWLQKHSIWQESRVAPQVFYLFV